jgi:hypothetical protein
MVTAVVEVTVDVDTLKTAVVDPAATVTFAGTLATPGLLLDNETTAPPDGAPLDKRTTP